MLMGRALIEVWRDVHAAGEVPRRKLVSMEQSLDDSGETSLEELLASTDDPVGIVMDRAAIREAASHLSTTQRRHISEAVRGNQACERLVRAVEAFASGLLSPTLHADLVDLIRSDGTQPVLIHLGPEPSSQEAQDLVASVLRSYDETQWCVICDIAEGYEPEEIARRRKIPTEVVSLMVGACRSTVSA
jgi:DNA-binding NarL/FixJ family response regulator